MKKLFRTIRNNKKARRNFGGINHSRRTFVLGGLAIGLLAIPGCGKKDLEIGTAMQGNMTKEELKLFAGELNQLQGKKWYRACQIIVDHVSKGSKVPKEIQEVVELKGIVFGIIRTVALNESYNSYYSNKEIERVLDFYETIEKDPWTKAINYLDMVGLRKEMDSTFISRVIGITRNENEPLAIDTRIADIMQRLHQHTLPEMMPARLKGLVEVINVCNVTPEAMEKIRKIVITALRMHPEPRTAHLALGILLNKIENVIDHEPHITESVLIQHAVETKSEHVAELAIQAIVEFSRDVKQNLEIVIEDTKNKRTREMAKKALKEYKKKK